ncbi:MAG TPA: response regulator, partial [Ktedonobacteraceae bacterium]
RSGSRTDNELVVVYFTRLVLLIHGASLFSTLFWKDWPKSVEECLAMAASILVINDDQSILELFHLILESEGYEVSSSLVVYEDVKDVEQLNPALIILDVRIGYHAEGLLLLQKLKMYPPTKNIPVILCTAALSEMREQEETLRQKKIPVLYKPFDMDELLKLVHQILPAPSLDQLEPL